MPEIFIYSSNIGSARMALAVGMQGQHDYLKRFGLLDTLQTELPEAGAPIVPKMPWARVTTVTMAFGHGISVSPMQTAAAGAALVNGGYSITPTFLPRTPSEAAPVAAPDPAAGDEPAHAPAVPPQCAEGLGPARRCPGLQRRRQDRHGGKGRNGRYSGNKRRNAFLAAFPMDAPKYLVLVVLDEPKPEKPGIGATAGLNTAPTVGNIIRRIAPMLGIEPKAVDPEDDPAMALAFAQ